MASLRSGFAPAFVGMLLGFAASSASAQKGVVPLCQTGCLDNHSPVQVTPNGAYTDTVTSGGGGTVTFTVKNLGPYLDTYYLTPSCYNTTCTSIQYTEVGLGAGSSVNVWVTFAAGSPNTTGTVSLVAADSGSTCGGGLQQPLPGDGLTTPEFDGTPMSANGSCYQGSGFWNIVNVAGPAPIVSLAPYSPSFLSATDGVIYEHSTPAVQSMGVSRQLTLAYNSSTVYPISLVTVDVSNQTGGTPSTYQLQVQLASNGTNLTMVNGATGIYYTAGTTTTTRMVAPVDPWANGLTTGEYPVNVVVSANYATGPRTVSVPSRLVVNYGAGSSFGAGVGLAGVERLFSVSGSNGWLLADGSGRTEYFDRTCPTCSFASPAGESRTLAIYNDQTLGQLYRLTDVGGRNITDFNANGRIIRHFLLPSIQDLTYTWTDTLLTSITDAGGRGFTLSYSNGKLARITDFAGRVTQTTISNGYLLSVADVDGLRDSLIYQGTARPGQYALLAGKIDRAQGAWGFAYNVLQQAFGDTAPAAKDYTGATVRPVTSIATPAFVVWQPSKAGTSAATAKGNVRPDTLFGSTKDPLARISKFALDRFGLPTKVIDALAETTTVVRDTLGHATQITQPNGRTSYASYNGYLLTSISDNVGGPSVGYYYDATNRLQYTSGSLGRYDFIYHDGTQAPAGTLKEVYLGNTAPIGQWYYPSGGAVVGFHYPNTYGLDTLAVDGLGHRTSAVYAAAGAGGGILQSVDALGHVTNFHYDSFGLVDTTTFATGAKSVAIYDSLNRVSRKVSALGYTTRFTYGATGLTRIVDPKGQIYKFDRNAWGLVTTRHDLADTTKADSFGYDMDGEPRIEITRRGDTLQVTYDALGRPLSRSGRDFPSETFSYGPNAAWVVASNANGRDSATLNQLGLPTFVSQRMPDSSTTYQMSYTYNADGRLVSRSAPTGGSSARWVYNAALLTLDTMCGAGTCIAFARDSELKPVSMTYNSSGTSPWYHYQVFDSLHMITKDSFSVAALNNDFGMKWRYDSLQRLSLSSGPGSGWLPPYHAFSYDLAGQLSNDCLDPDVLHGCSNEYGGTGSAYQYDSAGNRNEAITQPQIGPGNRVQRFKNYTLTYDLNGNLIQKAGLGNNGTWSSTDTTLFQWNAKRQLVRAEHWNAGGAHTVDTLGYDALGERVRKTTNGATTWFVYDRGEVVMDVNAGTKAMAAEYAYFGDNDLFAMRTPYDTLVAVRTPTTRTVSGLVKARTGGEVKIYDSQTLPWVEAPLDTGLVVRFRMGGQEYDQETGLYHLGARYYDPQMGRFLSEDPIGISGGTNLYRYAENNPIGRRDPAGLMTCPPGQSWQLILVTIDATTGKEHDEYGCAPDPASAGTDDGSPGGGSLAGSGNDVTDVGQADLGPLGNPVTYLLCIAANCGAIDNNIGPGILPNPDPSPISQTIPNPRPIPDDGIDPKEVGVKDVSGEAESEGVGTEILEGIEAGLSDITTLMFPVIVVGPGTVPYHFNCHCTYTM